MTPTLFVAVLAHGARPGEALTVDNRSRLGAPLMLTLSATRQQAERNLVEAARAEWDAVLVYGSGPSADWPDDALLLRAMRDRGYLATVTEQEVDL